MECGLSLLFCLKEVDTIKNIPISQVGSRDRLVWHLNNKGIYTVQLAFQQLQTKTSKHMQQVESDTGAKNEGNMWRRT